VGIEPTTFGILAQYEGIEPTTFGILAFGILAQQLFPYTNSKILYQEVDEISCRIYLYLVRNQTDRVTIG
jgi:hypothetical protein